MPLVFVALIELAVNFAAVAAIIGFVVAAYFIATSLYAGLSGKAGDPGEPLQAPTTTIGTNIPVIFGTRRCPVIIAGYWNVRIVKEFVNSGAKK